MLLQRFNFASSVLEYELVSIPQAVGVVATLFDGELGLETMQVSIPQAVGVVATGVYWFC